jgi:hypothetical protein
MPMLRNVAAGVVGALLGIMAWVIAVVGIPLAMALVRTSRDGGGALGVGVSVDTGSLTVAALAGFGVAYYWNTRRAKRIPERPRSGETR